MFSEIQKAAAIYIIFVVVFFSPGCADTIIEPITELDQEGDSVGIVDSETDGDDSDEGGDSSTVRDAGVPNDCQPLLKAKIRDFSNEHPDFMTFCCDNAVGLVADDLGADDKPVFASAYSSENPEKQSITDGSTFAQWYNTITGINFETVVDLQLTAVNENTWEYRNNEFFPLSDDFGFGNEYQAHNYSFTTEIHMMFVYEKGQLFTFTGDDDLWIFVGRKLAMDLGGVHAETSGSIDMDEWAEKLGMEAGESYPMDIFHAERNPGASNFHVETNIFCIVPII